MHSVHYLTNHIKHATEFGAKGITGHGREFI